METFRNKERMCPVKGEEKKEKSTQRRENNKEKQQRGQNREEQSRQEDRKGVGMKDALPRPFCLSPELHGGSLETPLHSHPATG